MVSSRQTTAVENDNNISLDLAPHLASGVLENTNESEKESDDSEAEEGSRGCPETPEGDEWTPVTHKRQSLRRLSLPSMQSHTIKTQNSLYRTSNVPVFAPVGADRADIANAVHRGDFFMKLRTIQELFETYEYSYDGNWLGYTPDESTVRDRQLWH